MQSRINTSGLLEILILHKPLSTSAGNSAMRKIPSRPVARQHDALYFFCAVWTKMTYPPWLVLSLSQIPGACSPMPHMGRLDSRNALQKGRQGYIPRIAAPWLVLCWFLLGNLLILSTSPNPTSGSQLPCCPGRKFPGWPARPVYYWAGLACPNHILIALRPLTTVFNPCPCKHFPDPSCSPPRPLEWGRRNITTEGILRGD